MNKKPVLCGLLAAMFYKDNYYVYAQRRSLYDTRIPEAFNDTKIVQISDLHGMVFGKHNEKLLKKVRKFSPDMIFITGDVIRHSKSPVDSQIELMENLTAIAPCYFVLGNHENLSPDGHLAELLQAMKKCGVTILNNQKVTIEKDGQKMNIAGVMDPHMISDQPADQFPIMEAELNRLHLDPDTYTILLSHRPEMFKLFKKHGINMIFAGHTHGGQVRFPFFHAFYAPNQGIFPKYDEGFFDEDGTVMYVSRGLGHSGFPLRINATPEIVVMTLKSKSHFSK